MFRSLTCLLSVQLMLLIGGLMMVNSQVIAADSPFHQNPNELVVTIGDEFVSYLPCERIKLEYDWPWQTHQIGTGVGRTSDGKLYAAVNHILFSSADGGQTWSGWDSGVPSVSAFLVLKDDSFLMARGVGGGIEFHRSTDRGRTWELVSTLSAEPFERIGEGFLALTQLRDGTVLFPVCRWNSLPEGTLPAFPQYVFRSTDGGLTWAGGGDSELWRTLNEARLVPRSVGPDSRWPGEGGTFPGCLETHLLELADGKLLAAFRYSGYSPPWHKEKAEGWGGRPQPDGIGRYFKNVFLGDSLDGGRTWQSLRPLLDAQGQALLEVGECHGQLVQVPDGRVVLVHDFRYPYLEMQVLAHISEDGGQTWLPEKYRLSFGYGYPSSTVLDDGTIITVTGCPRMSASGHMEDPDAYEACIILWRPS